MSTLTRVTDFSKIESVLIAGDLAKLTNEERVSYNMKVCESLGMNPLTRPFEFITLNGKMVMYAKRDATDQLRRIHDVSIVITSREKIGEIYVVTSRATLPSGRTDESTGAVSLGKLSGEALANAYLKCETKSKRRVTLSICGLGLLDETEVETVARDIQPIEVSKPIATTMNTASLVKTKLPNDGDFASEHQRQLIRKAAFKRQLSSDDIMTYLKAYYGVNLGTELTRAQADEVIKLFEDSGTTAEVLKHLAQQPPDDDPTPPSKPVFDDNLDFLRDGPGDLPPIKPPQTKLPPPSIYARAVIKNHAPQSEKVTPEQAQQLREYAEIRGYTATQLSDLVHKRFRTRNFTDLVPFNLKVLHTLIEAGEGKS